MTPESQALLTLVGRMIRDDPGGWRYLDADDVLDELADRLPDIEAAAHARGVAEERARWERSIGNVRGWLKSAQGYLVDARADPAPDRDIEGADRCIDAALDRIAALQHPHSGTQDGPGAPEAV